MILFSGYSAWRARREAVLHGIRCRAGYFPVQKVGEQKDEKESWTLDETFDAQLAVVRAWWRKRLGAGIKLPLHTSRLVRERKDG